jgi:hypothetical protein
MSNLTTIPEVIPPYADMFTALKALNVTQTAMTIDAHDVPSFYCRYLDFGFDNKYLDLLKVNPIWNVSVWVREFGFSPNNSGKGYDDRKYLIQIYCLYLICFAMSVAIEKMSALRYNWQARALNDHNPLIIRKGLQSLTAQKKGMDQSIAEQRASQEKAEYKQWRSIQETMRLARRQNRHDQEGLSVHEFEQMKHETEEHDDRFNKEILSIPNNIKIWSTVLYCLSNVFSLLQLMALFSTLELFLVACILAGQLVGMLMFSFKRKRVYLHVYNPLGSIA